MMEAARVHRFKKGSGLPIKAPVIDMIEIGAGGGSIAAIDEVGLLRVGPHSAGADPGPACYGARRHRADGDRRQPAARLLRSRLLPRRPHGAGSRRRANARWRSVGAKLGLGAIDTAWGIHRMVVENMAAAARIHIVEKGKDPRAYAMVGFGGAGPAHAAEVARVLGVKQVLIPPASGAASALGFLAAPLSFEQVRSHPVRLDAPDAAATIDAILRELTEAARAAAGRPTRRWSPSAWPTCAWKARCTRSACALPDGAITDATMPAIRDGIRRRLCRAIYIRLCRRRRDGGVVPRALPRAAAAALADRSRRGVPPARRRRARARPGSMAASSIRRSTTAMRWRPARASPARRSSRSARRPPSSRPATASPSMPPARWRSTSASPPRPPRASPPTRRSNRPPR